LADLDVAFPVFTLGEDWLTVVAETLGGAYYHMGLAHIGMYYHYGLLVEEDIFGFITWDIYGYDFY